MYLDIKGSAFLCGMIRCIVAILTLVGQQCEEPEKVKELLDVINNDKKLQYLASEISRNLFSCNYRNDLPDHRISTNVKRAQQRIFDEEALGAVIIDMQEHWCNKSEKSSTMIYEMLKECRPVS